MNIRKENIFFSFMALSFAGCVSTVPNFFLDAEVIKAGLTAAASAKVCVTEAFVSSGVWADSNAKAGYGPPTTGPAVVTVRAGGGYHYFLLATDG